MYQSFILLIVVLCFFCPSYAQTADPADQQETIRTLVKEVNELKARIAVLEAKQGQAQAPAAEPGKPESPPQQTPPAAGEREPFNVVRGIKLQGFASVSNRTNDANPPEGASFGFRAGSASNFAVGSVDLFLTSHVTDKALVLAEVSFDETSTQEFQADVERMLLKYNPNDHLKMSFGRFHTATSYYNSIYHHGLWLQTAADRPLVVEFDPGKPDIDAVVAGLADATAAYRKDYAAYYERCKHPDSPGMRDANAVVYLIPGVGMLTFAKDKATARISGEFYVNAINVMRESEGVSTYCGLPEQEAFDIEYWALEEAKLKRMPKPKLLAGRVALITGGAGGIGLASARRLVEDGACVVLCDIDRAALAEARGALQREYGADCAVDLWVDVTDESTVADLYRDAACNYGGIDICISNAGIASAAPVEATSLELWRRNMDVLATGYFLIARQAVQLLRLQDLGGSIVFIGSKNALAASPGAAAYCTAKAAELHLARCLALECAVIGIRVNVVNPDAVLRGSRIWQGEWAEQRARQNNTTPDELEAVYRERSLLKRSVYPEDVAEAVAFLASDRAAKSTGNILNVDAGNAGAFTR